MQATTKHAPVTARLGRLASPLDSGRRFGSSSLPPAPPPVQNSTAASPTVTDCRQCHCVPQKCQICSNDYRFLFSSLYSLASVRNWLATLMTSVNIVNLSVLAAVPGSRVVLKSKKLDQDAEMLLVLAKGAKHSRVKQSTSGKKNSCAEAATRTEGLVRFPQVHPTRHLKI
ncbi:hypothetical protein Cgig2_019755 [Carnegiea gigantea]|uniref:Uncharacterized protein n=1 Tax=Carnegiea gigantea TaxID=171969 RepID=A0A9Q1KNQ8_9CARY|nr:hypothetical protein Cgig2_019755 [Carnegiea gigantea]